MAVDRRHERMDRAPGNLTVEVARRPVGAGGDPDSSSSANRFKSSSEASEDFIHDPLGVLIQAETDGAISGLGLSREWKVTTHVVNHHQTLSATHLYAMVTANSARRSVGVTLVKKGS